MGRALLDVPLTALLAQAGETQGHLRNMAPVREALEALGFDLEGAEAELEAATVEGWARDAEVGAADLRERAAQEHRADIARRVTKWVSELRLRFQLALVNDAGTRMAVAALRERLTGNPRTFAGAFEMLSRTVPELRAYEPALAPHFGRPSPLIVGEALLVEATEAHRELPGLVAIRRARQADAQVSRARVQAALRRIRHHWALARLRTEEGVPLPAMPVEVLAEVKRKVKPRRKVVK